MQNKALLFDSIMNNISDVFYRTNETGTLIVCSRSILKLFGFQTMDDVIGKNVLGFYENPDDREELIRQLDKYGSVSDYEIQLKNTEGKKILVSTTSSYYYNKNNECAGVEGIFRDISYRKAIESELENYRNHLEELVAEQVKDLKTAKEKAESANRAKTAFLANITHEIKTPLHGILSFAELGVVKSVKLDAEKNKKYFSTIHSSGKRLLSLLNDLLDYTKMEAGKMEYDFAKVDFCNIVNVVAEEYYALLIEKNIQLDIKTSEFNRVILGDGGRLSQVVSNLFSNAIKFSEPNSIIYISFESENLKLQGCDKLVPGLSMIIDDQGIGIPENECESIFKKFIQSSAGQEMSVKGTGLGLAICKQIVSAHNGRIYAENRDDGRVRFVVTLPLVPDVF